MVLLGTGVTCLPLPRLFICGPGRAILFFQWHAYCKGSLGGVLNLNYYVIMDGLFNLYLHNLWTVFYICSNYSFEIHLDHHFCCENKEKAYYLKLFWISIEYSKMTCTTTHATTCARCNVESLPRDLPQPSENFTQADPPGSNMHTTGVFIPALWTCLWTFGGKWFLFCYYLRTAKICTIADFHIFVYLFMTFSFVTPLVFLFGLLMQLFVADYMCRLCHEIIDFVTPCFWSS